MRPNTIVFFTDQQRWDTTGIHGNPLNLTPNFDRIARTGTHVANSITCQPVCGPARSCMQSGRFATETGCFRNGIGLPADTRTLAHLFSDAGYSTAYIGKWHLAGGHDDPVPRDQQGGYDYWLGANLLEFTSDAYDTRVFDGDGQEVFLPGYRVDALTDAAIRYIHTHRRQNPDKPFFLYFSLLEPHHQNHVDAYPAPRGYELDYTGRYTPPDLQALGGSSARHLPGYYGMVKRIDEAFGRMLDALESLGILEETNMLFTSDHGSHFKTRNGEYKRSCHESSVRVPTALCGPAFDGGGRVDAPVSLIDLPPTLLHAAGIEPPAVYRGRSIVPLLGGGRDGQRRDSVFIQISEAEVGRAVRTRRWKYAVRADHADPNGDPGADEYTEAFLYDLKHDPYELENLVDLDSHTIVRDRLREELQMWMQEAGEPRARIHPPSQLRRAPARSIRPEEIV